LEDEVSDNEVIRRKTRRNEKRPAPAGTSLETLNLKYNMDLYEPAVPRPTAEIVSNLYLIAPPHCYGSSKRPPLERGNQLPSVS